MPLALLVKSFAEIVPTMSSITCFIIANAAGARGCGCCGDVGSGIWAVVAVDMIPPCEQVALLPGWVHIRLCGCGVGEDVVAAAANDPSVKIRTTATTIAPRALIVAVLFKTYPQTICMYIWLG